MNYKHTPTNISWQIREQERLKQHAEEKAQSKIEEERWKKQQLSDFLREEEIEDPGESADPTVTFNIRGKYMLA